MSDPLRTNDAAEDAERDAKDRDAKIEQLLLAGLDHYFSGQYEHAINVWTRALFLDRSHARARAYIERARSALAEGQRENDELLQSGLAAFERGDSHEARRLLQSAIGRGAPPDEALAVLDRLDRLDVTPTASVEAEAVPVRHRRAAAREAQPRASLGFRVAVVVATLAIVAGVAFVARSGRAAFRPFPVAGVFDMLGLFGRSGGQAAPVPLAAEEGLGLPRRGEIALGRAQSLRASGHLHDALAALDAVRITDAERPDADRLRGEIQRQLITRTP